MGVRRGGETDQQKVIMHKGYYLLVFASEVNSTRALIGSLDAGYPVLSTSGR